MKQVRIGGGAGYSGDRIEPAIELAEKGQLHYLVFECLAERTIALAQQARLRNPDAGYDPLLAERFHAVLPSAHANGVRIVTNMGAANPEAAARRIAEIALELGLKGLKIAAVTGDDVLSQLAGSKFSLEEIGGAVDDIGKGIVSANAYIGAESIAEALNNGADIVVTGRAADPSLFVGPLMHEFNWRTDDWPRLGQATLFGHLLECAGQVTGGYFADPGYKDVPDLARLGFPIGEFSEDGTIVITKVPGTGGSVTEAGCKEQILYEIHDPARYLTPDVVADFSHVTVEEIGPDRVRIHGASGHPRPETLKVSVGVVEGFVGEGQISYAGHGARARGELALDIVRARLKAIGVEASQLRFDLIGLDALHGRAFSLRRPHDEPYEVRVRVAGRTSNLAEAVRIGNEVETLYTNGPAGGGGVVKSARETIGILSTYIPRGHVRPMVHYLES
ncbi:ABC transporter substrate-binding protein [Brucella endophytica]|uniref:ABC transporter substrate-binding protein n=1 Tax=Brucella endophytica TaxID=1963359 RepID=A0A916SK71_9HYPH|nr:acyclic terpene utilization AtuA family protein [Brucella endophytica]GGB04420.1 ABC transporter substrate-binding protein [Brucella endophytica]